MLLYSNLQNIKLFGNEKESSDHTLQFIEDEKQNSPKILQKNYRDRLGEFSNIVPQYGVLMVLRGLILLSICIYFLNIYFLQTSSEKSTQKQLTRYIVFSGIHCLQYIFRLVIENIRPLKLYFV